MIHIPSAPPRVPWKKRPQMTQITQITRISEMNICVNLRHLRMFSPQPHWHSTHGSD